MNGEEGIEEVSLRDGFSLWESIERRMSLRTSPQTGVGIPRIEVKTTGLGSKIFENSGDCHGSVRTASQ